MKRTGGSLAPAFFIIAGALMIVTVVVFSANLAFALTSSSKNPGLAAISDPMLSVFENLVDHSIRGWV